MATNRAAVVGHPIGHSLSPALHRAAYAALGLDWVYERHDVPAGGLAEFVAGLDSSWRGLSVTMPLKSELLRLGTPDELSVLLGAANTLVLGSDGTRCVHNTDVAGIVSALAGIGVSYVAAARLLGAGGTARAGLAALGSLGCERVDVFVREPARAAGLAELGGRLGLNLQIAAFGSPVGPTDVTISTLPPGAADELGWALESTSAALDVAYDPWPTRFARRAAELGLSCASGLDLLAGQAVEQVRLMTGGVVGVGLLRTAGLTELASRHSSSAC